MNEEFDFTDWENSRPGFPELFQGQPLPFPPDRYREGTVSWGKSVTRGRAIIRARAAKARATNETFFLSEILPQLKGNLSLQSSVNLCRQFPQLWEEFGFVRYSLGERASWIHPELEPQKIVQAQAMGATALAPACP